MHFLTKRVGTLEKFTLQDIGSFLRHLCDGVICHLMNHTDWTVELKRTLGAKVRARDSRDKRELAFKSQDCDWMECIIH